MAGKHSRVTGDAGPVSGLRIPAERLNDHRRHLEREVLGLALARTNFHLQLGLTRTRSTTLTIQAAEGSVPAKTGRGSEQVIRIKSTVKRNLFLGLTEEWIQDRQFYIFKESRLRFYVHRVGDSSIGPPLVRLEWEAEDIRPDVGFHGNGAGHPHWHFGSDVEGDEVQGDDDGGPATVDALADELSRDDMNDDALLEELTNEDSTIAKAETPVGNTAQPFSLKRFHFAARANWASTPWDMTGDRQGRMSHAAGPVRPEDLVNWARSATLYIANELEKYGD